MKKIWILVLIGLLPVMVMGQSNINVLYAFRTYHSPSVNYAEINTSIETSSLKAELTNQGKYIKSAELTTIICPLKQSDSAVYVDKRIIKTPQMNDSNQLNNISLLDMQRMELQNDTFVVYFELKDMANNLQPMQYRDMLVISYPKDEINLSDIMIIDKYAKTKTQNIYSKNGFDLTPYIFDIIPQDSNKLDYYVEVYNSDKAFKEDYILVTNIENISTKKKVETIQTFKRLKPNSIIPYIGSLDLSSLSEGSYYLNVEVRDKDNILYAYKRYPFYKQSKNKKEIVNQEIPSDAFVNFIADSNLKDAILSVRPIASENEVDYIVSKLDNSTAAQDRYFLYHIFERQNPYNPNQAWNNYSTMVNQVNAKYSTKIKKGYDTDMGRVILSYGYPDDIIDEKFAASTGFQKRSEIDRRLDPYAPDVDPDGVNYYPYQIWIYNTTPFGESNRKFVFYAKGDNLMEYFLLHSNAKGELQDMYWERTLSKNSLDEGVEGKAGKQFRTGHR